MIDIHCFMEYSRDANPDACFNENDHVTARDKTPDALPDFRTQPRHCWTPRQQIKYSEQVFDVLGSAFIAPVFGCVEVDVLKIVVCLFG